MILSLEEAREIYQGVEIHPSTVIYPGVVIHPGTVIHPDVVIHPGALIHPGTVIHPGALICADVVIHEGAVICADVVIHEGAVIGAFRKNVSENLVIHGIGSTKNITAYKCDDGLIINIGCANEYKGLPIDDMRELISKKYDSDHEYFDAMNLIEKWYKKL